MRLRSIHCSELAFKRDLSVPVCLQVLQIRSSCSLVSLSFSPRAPGVSGLRALQSVREAHGLQDPAGGRGPGPDVRGL